jgi:hypothetical protein
MYGKDNINLPIREATCMLLQCIPRARDDDIGMGMQTATKRMSTTADSREEEYTLSIMKI